ncbi:TetR/AcrR family transcriptional regulator [Bacillus sp. FJAT-28004]|uniref:TetR/AcrR family transcriptional regulator n=1 Tax=Bacillus sp. FJAT-28004 TaxID=1679165 RepID=UPI0006B684BB|nr:TetR/AcrR family transcriptional regulator [Bacillus sp. FJAT-28004]
MTNNENKLPTRKRLLLAASNIVLKQGMAKLTLEAVSKEAGVSKGGLLHYFPNKESLVEGLVNELTQEFEEDIEERVQTEGDTPGKWVRSYVKSTFESEESGLEIGTVFSAALYANPDMLLKIQTLFAAWQKNIENDGIDPVHATIARLAADGLWFSEIFGMRPLDEQLRTRVFEQLIKWTEEETV